ncbi:MAG: peptide chain release factor 3 [Chlorobia bacterium]|nr:peptide chain release factor 3 [Fimbriimonadaceae bacterium]
MQPSPITLEAQRRRTFAIISHPDAGKTTLTEKLLLYGGAIQLAGSVKARHNQRAATSDWMELEKQRGISITSTVLQFEYRDHVLNLLDTPGHDDFSADTYRTLTAADSAVMLIDNAKGTEAQTKKLFAVCKQRGIPIFTFVNKLDHEGPGPLAILADLEASLGIHSVPINWPIGQGRDFKGICDRDTRTVHLYEKVAHGSTRATTRTISLDDPLLLGIIGQELHSKLLEDLDLLSIAGESLDLDRVLAGDLTPVFFGSALTNFGVSLFLDSFLAMAPNPVKRIREIADEANTESFSGFVFKIQANMDPNHRDRISFMRVVTGAFEKDMEALNQRSGKRLKLSRPQRLFAQERETVETAFPGDIVGLTNPGAFQLGDTVTTNPKIRYDEVPEFVPEVFARLTSMDVARLKHFEKGIQQLSQEGLIQLLWDTRSHRKEPILGAVGKLQFEVVQHRLMSEYGVKTSLEPLPYEIINWLDGDKAEIEGIYWGTNAYRLNDHNEVPVVLIMTEWNRAYLEKQNPKVRFLASPSSSFTALASGAS